MELRNLIKKSRFVDVEYQGEKLRVEYAPERMTATYTQRLADAGRQEGFGPLCEVLAEVLLSWDLTDNGKPTKPTKDLMMQLPFWLMIAVSDRVMEDFNSGKVQTPSVNGSSAQTASATAS